MPAYLSVPLPATIDLFGEQQSLHDNHCRNPRCENFGVPARTRPDKAGPCPDRDMACKVHSTSRANSQSVRFARKTGRPAGNDKISVPKL